MKTRLLILWWSIQMRLCRHERYTVTFVYDSWAECGKCGATWNRDGSLR